MTVEGQPSPAIMPPETVSSDPTMLYQRLVATSKDLNPEPRQELLQRLKDLREQDQLPQNANPFLIETPSRPSLPELLLGDSVTLQFINARDLQKEHQVLTEMWPKFSADYTSRFNTAVERGYIPPNVAERLPDALNKTKVMVSDGIIMNEHNAAGSYHREEDELRIAHDMIDDDFAKEILVHEVTHKLSGGTFFDQYRQRSGVSNCLNEAKTEYITQGLLHGDFETITPTYETGRIYGDYRDLLSAFVQKSGGIIDVKTLIAAYFEDTTPQGNFGARRALVQQTTQAYGRGALVKLEQLMKATVVHDAEHMAATYIIPPTIVDGTVVRRGSINTNELLFPSRMMPFGQTSPP